MKKRFLTLTVFLLTALLAFSSCGKAEITYGDSFSKEDAAVENGFDYEEPSSGNASTDMMDISTQSTTSSSDRKIIMRYAFSVETKDIDNSVSMLEKAVTESGGYYESARVEGNTEDGGWAELILRIPAAQTEEFNLGISELGNITSQTKSGDDVTTAYYDTENQLKSLKVQQERLLALLEKAESLDDILKLESELTRVRTEIESLTTTLVKYDNLIDYCTVTVTLSQVKVYTAPEPETFGTKIAGTFKSSIEFTKEVLQGIVIAIVWLAPFLVFSVVVAVVIVVIVKSGKKKKNKKAEVNRINKDSEE